MTGRFIGELILIHRDEPINKKWFQTYKEFNYLAKDNTLYHIPKGVDTDFASIPRVFRRVIPRTGRHDKAAVLHDYLCESGVVPRKKADKLFLEGMKVLKVGFIKRRVMYSAVAAYTKGKWLADKVRG